jgi:hypothetical protein
VDTEPNPTGAVNPSPASIAALAARPDDDAILMVNLLRYAPDGGREAYGRYGKVAYGTVTARGGRIAYTAAVLGDDPAWDTVTLVRYPRRAAYLDMQRDPAYVSAIADRTRGLAARLLYPFHPAGGDPDDPFRIERPAGDGVIVVCLVRAGADRDPTGTPAGRGGMDPNDIGEVLIRLQGDVPMVSDDRWDELVILRYPSLDALPAGGPGPRPGADPGVAAAITLVTRPLP